MDSYYAHGKLLLTGEYVVLNGATGIAVPTRVGQYLTIEENSISPTICWKSLDHNNEIWFSADFDPSTLQIANASHPQIAQTLCDILKGIRNDQVSFLAKPVKVITKLEFDRTFGLGSSSTLISLLAQASGVNPFELNEQIFKSSGYDIACATSEHPIIYNRVNHQSKKVELSTLLKESSYFVYLGKKQNSQEAIQQYEPDELESQMYPALDRINSGILSTHSYNELEEFISSHEAIISDMVQLPKVKDLLFNDYWSAIKSLGAWGGDFIWVLSDRGHDATQSYFNSKGLDTFYSYKQLVLDE